VQVELKEDALLGLGAVNWRRAVNAEELELRRGEGRESWGFEKNKAADMFFSLYETYSRETGRRPRVVIHPDKLNQRTAWTDPREAQLLAKARALIGEGEVRDAWKVVDECYGIVMDRVVGGGSSKVSGIECSGVNLDKKRDFIPFSAEPRIVSDVLALRSWLVERKLMTFYKVSERSERAL